MTTIVEYKKEIEWKDNNLEFRGFRFRLIQKSLKYHVDVLINGKWKSVGNYRMREWAMYYSPILYLQKNGIIE